ncbi:MAG: TolC family protein [Prevotella sp.]|uniref:TolC family protein n=1 Tax=Prevotella sp. TaxID=59823 RepID=UPI002A33B71A|nr:TolC family protein [Prevotella sp.]MDD7318503.1 TolC family protein [Prevotellaceae bacterium]MDY4020308.1 TolC family protein [Prevotella sp.]
MYRLLSFVAAVTFSVNLCAQRVLSLEDCRNMALENNKQLNMARLNQEVALNTRKAARTKYLPRVSAIGGYELTSREISLLSDDQKNALDNIGTNVAGKMGGSLTQMLSDFAGQGLITPQMAQTIGGLFSNIATPIAQTLNGVGTNIKQGLRTNTRNSIAASVTVMQPVYTGGAISAANRLAELNEQLTVQRTELSRQTTLYEIDQAYWLVVSVKHKERLARNYLELVRKFDQDVRKMYEEGVATRSDELQVSVKVNEAEMQLMQAEDGAALSKMLLCQLCGMEAEEDITLADEDTENLQLPALYDGGERSSYQLRPELQMLQTSVDMTEASTKLARAAYLPQVAVTGGYLVTNPNLYNGFERKFGGTWNVGVLVSVPIWSWNEGTYKVRATKAATQIARLELSEATEKIGLQVSQCRFKVKEAHRRYALAVKNVEKAEENLRCANLGFSEGVMQTTDVMAAQTAWLQSQTQKVEAEIEARLSDVALRKALGEL